MAEAEAGLIIPVGFTERAAAQAAARIEAQAIKAAKASEQAFVKANANIVKSTGAMSGQMRGQIQNVSYQLQDVFVQIAGGTDASRALSQQLPQLASGFGAVGAVIGTVLAVAIPLAAQFITLGDGTEELAEATTAAEKALKAFHEAVGNASVSTAELQQRFGAAYGEARQLLNVLAETAEAKAILAQQEAVSALTDRFSELQGMIDTYNATLASSDPLVAAGAGAWLDEIRDKYGLTLEQAQRLLEITDQIDDTSGEARVAMLVEMASILKEAALNGADVDAELVNMTDSAASAALAVAEIDNANFGNAIAQVDALHGRLGALIAQANSAAAALNASGVFVGSDGSIQTGARGKDPSTAWRFEDPNKDYDTIGERRAREAAEKAAAAAREAKRLAGGGGGGGRKKSGGGGRSGGAAKEPVNIFETAEREIQQLERQIAVLGKSSEETARLQAQWAMLDAAKKAGIPINDQLNAQIAAQADQVGNLTAQLEQAQLAQEQFDQAIDGIANAFSNAILEGENLRDSLAQIFRQIAANILNAGIQQALTSAFSGVGGGGGFWGGLLSAAFGGTKAAVPTFGGARANGGPVTAGQMYLTGERGPEPFVPAVNGRILSVAQAQAALRGGQGGGRSVTFAPQITIGGSVTQGDIDRVMIAMRGLRNEVPSIMDNHQKRRG
ncbi:hypothetical protein [Paracoccus yeei]|uniref:hypothetical protein n=1 Tax=Paracoccus yeei TaxID=147645 RepID=UPI003BF86CF4